MDYTTLISQIGFPRMAASKRRPAPGEGIFGSQNALADDAPRLVPADAGGGRGQVGGIHSRLSPQLLHVVPKFQPVPGRV
jgi:hypothetical protein